MDCHKKLTVWYSAPSILSLLAQFGKLNEHDYSLLRLVLFAGEVFPIRYLKLLKSLWKHPRYFNLYGPTETNVCTFYEVPQLIPESQNEPVPIGNACPYCEPLVVIESGSEVGAGDEGELCIAGPSVLQGYWDLPENTAKAFLPGRDTRWYRTGDIVVELPNGNYNFLGRRNRMIGTWPLLLARVVAENFDGQDRLSKTQKYEMRSETAEQSASAQHLQSFSAFVAYATLLQWIIANRRSL